MNQSEIGNFRNKFLVNFKKYVEVKKNSYQNKTKLKKTLKLIEGYQEAESFTFRTLCGNNNFVF